MVRLLRLMVCSWCSVPVVDAAKPQRGPWGPVGTVQGAERLVRPGVIAGPSRRSTATPPRDLTGDGSAVPLRRSPHGLC